MPPPLSPPATAYRLSQAVLGPGSDRAASPPATACRLSQAVLGPGSDRAAATSFMFYCLTPSSIFHSMLYSESCYGLLSFAGLYCLYCRGSSLAAAMAFALASFTRSNGGLGF